MDSVPDEYYIEEPFSVGPLIKHILMMYGEYQASHGASPRMSLRYRQRDRETDIEYRQKDRYIDR